MNIIREENLMNEYLEIKNVSKTFSYPAKGKSRLEVLNNFSLSVGKGEFLTFFGPNACGKTTLLNIVSGLISSDNGSVLIDGRLPSQAKIGFVFQNYQNSLLPWRTNIDNVALSLEIEGVSKKQRLENARNFLRKFKIDIPEDSYPYQLSGGQQQLLCIARALISDPDVLLMDEPFNQLDFQTRIGMNEKIQDIWMKTGKTIIFVSHDLDEAVLLADRVVLLTERPARIAKILENKLPRPRKTKVLQDEEFFKLKGKALEIFEKVLK